VAVFKQKEGEKACFYRVRGGFVLGEICRFIGDCSPE